jgi:Cd2+/Zn2+-exporting ATPase
VLAAVTGLVFIAPMALASLRRRTADMNVLMGIAVIGGLVMGFLGDTEVFRDAAIVIFLDQVGEWLEGWSMRKTSGSIRELMDLTPDVAHLVDELGYATDVDVKLVEEGQRIRILPGERVPLDGVILSGSSSFNEAPVTGESIPQDKGVGQEVYAGSLNANSVVDIEVTADEDCTTIARIISLVQGAQAEKAPYEGFVDRFAAAYTPVVVAGALVVGIVVPLVASFATGFSGALWHDWVYRALSLLVVACPCALVISTPVSFVSALTRAAKSGVLVKGGAYFDVATKVTTVAFDKTGTLTTGRPQVSEVVCFNGATERDVLQIARTLEEASTHPLARAVVDRAVDLGIPAARPEQVEEVASNGMCATVNGVTYVVGKLAFARSHARVSRRVAEVVERLGAQGASALVVCGGGRVAGVIGVADTMRPAAAFAMQDLAQTGVAQTVMLTGDNAHAAAAIAGQAGVSTYAAELLPADKVEHLKGLQQGGQVVAMVGDGINDAPALATADLGITIGAAASDTALEVADVALLSDDLSQLPAFFRLARKTMNVVRENIAFAIGVKVLVFVLVVLGVAGMGAAVFADTGVALLVILNGMRLMLDSKTQW